MRIKKQTARLIYILLNYIDVEHEMHNRHRFRKGQINLVNRAIGELQQMMIDGSFDKRYGRNNEPGLIELCEMFVEEIEKKNHGHQETRGGRRPYTDEASSDPGYLVDTWPV